MTMRQSAEVRFEPDVPAGSPVWLTAAWVNPRLQPGPIAPPVRSLVGCDSAMIEPPRLEREAAVRGAA